MGLRDAWVAAVFRHNFVMLLARPKRLVRVETGDQPVSSRGSFIP